LVNGKCRTACLWAAKMLRRHFPDRLLKLTIEELFDWLASDNSVLNDLAIEMLERVGGLETIPVERWLKLTESARTDLLDRICDIVIGVVKREAVSFTDAVRLAMQRPVPLARLGRAFLTGKQPGNEAEIQALFGLREAEAEPLRADFVKWATRVLS